MCVSRRANTDSTREIKRKGGFSCGLRPTWPAQRFEFVHRGCSPSQFVAEGTVERFSISSLDPALLDFRAWPNGNLDNLDVKELASYEARQRAVELALQEESGEVRSE